MMVVKRTMIKVTMMTVRRMMTPVAIRWYLMYQMSPHIMTAGPADEVCLWGRQSRPASSAATTSAANALKQDEN